MPRKLMSEPKVEGEIPSHGDEANVAVHRKSRWHLLFLPLVFIFSAGLCDDVL